MGLWIGIALGSIIPLILLVAAGRSAFRAAKRRPALWLLLGLVGAAAGAGMGVVQSGIERKAEAKDFDAGRGSARCNLVHCRRPPAGSVEWSRTFTYTTETSSQRLPGGTVVVHLCDVHRGQPPEDFYYRLDAAVVIGAWGALGLVLGLGLAWFFSKA